MHKTKLQKIWKQVPNNYYTRGIRRNILQFVWHTVKWQHVRLLLPSKAMLVLDVGCACGHISVKLQKRFPLAHITGVDVSEDFIAFAKHTHTAVSFRVADAQKLPFADKSFDVIVCTEVLEHVVRPKKVLLEIRRCLTNNGVAIISMDSGSLLFRIVWFLWTYFGPGRVWRDAHVTHFTAASLKNSIRASGFTITKEQTSMLGMAVYFQVRKA